MVVITAASCSGGAQPAQPTQAGESVGGTVGGAAETSDGTASEGVEFVGSPAEYNEAVQNCLVRDGWNVEVGSDGALIVDGGDDEVWAAYQDCRDVVGVQPMSNLSEDELRSRYEWRLEQYQCMVDAGFDMGTQVSFEAFVDTYERTGVASWAPSEVLSDRDSMAAVELCPYSTSEW